MNSNLKVWSSIAALTLGLFLLSISHHEVRKAWTETWDNATTPNPSSWIPEPVALSGAAQDVLANLRATVKVNDRYDAEPYLTMAPLIRRMEDDPDLFSEYQTLVTQELAEMTVVDKSNAFDFPLVAYVDQKAAQDVLVEAITQRLESSDTYPEITDHLILMLGEWSINAEPLDFLIGLEDRAVTAVGALASKLNHADADRPKAIQFLEERLDHAEKNVNNHNIAVAQTALARVYH